MAPPATDERDATSCCDRSGFAAGLADRALVVLMQGRKLADVDAFGRGELPRRLWRVAQVVPVLPNIKARSPEGALLP